MSPQHAETPPAGPKNAYLTMLWRAWRLRCPRCGQGKLFKGLFRMEPECSSCHLRYEREPGYFLGSIYINYGLTALLVTIGYLTLFFTGTTSPDAAFWIVTGFAAMFPIWFFRYARSLWLGFDHFWDPMAGDPAARQTPRNTDSP